MKMLSLPLSLSLCLCWSFFSTVEGDVDGVVIRHELGLVGVEAVLLVEFQDSCSGELRGEGRGGHESR